MKKIFTYTLLSILALMSLASCKGTWVMYDMDQKSRIFFKDQIRDHTFSFAMVASDEEVEISTTVYLMGKPMEQDQTFILKSVPCKEGETIKVGDSDFKVFSATEGTDFELGALVFPAGATEAEVKIKLHRNAQMLQNEYAKIHLQLVPDEVFDVQPYDDYRKTEIISPEFIFYVTDGEPTCPAWWVEAKTKPVGWNYNLGNFYPEKYRRFMSLFNATKESCPIFYDAIVEMYGEKLDSPEINLSFWRTNYPNVWAKYIFAPLYDYYLEYYKQHPDDPHFEEMGNNSVNLKGRTGWASPIEGQYGFLN